MITLVLYAIVVAWGFSLDALQSNTILALTVFGITIVIPIFIAQALQFDAIGIAIALIMFVAYCFGLYWLWPQVHDDIYFLILAIFGMFAGWRFAFMTVFGQ